MTDVADVPAECPNCGTRRAGAYCGTCGQKATSLDPTLREFFAELFEELLNLDGKIVRSIRFLLTRPGFLTRELFDGRRIRYVAPIRLYLLFSLFYFALSALSPISAVRVTTTSNEPGSAPQIEQRRLDVQAAANQRFIEWAPRAMFLMVPVFAGLVMLTTRKAGRNYPAHLYFALHVHAAMFFNAGIGVSARAAAVPYLSAAVIAAATLYPPIYLVTAYRRAYGVSVLRAVLACTAVGGAYALIVLLTLLAIVAPTIFGGR